MDFAQLDAYREQADRFIAELDEEYYLHYAGHKETLDLEEIYARHSDLTTAEIAHEIGQQVDGDARVRELWRFACEGHLGELDANVRGEACGARGRARGGGGRRAHPAPPGAAGDRQRA